MLRSDIKPNVRTYTALITGWCCAVCGRPGQAGVRLGCKVVLLLNTCLPQLLLLLHPAAIPA